MIKAAIIGGAGYTGGEAIRILINHPDADLVYVHSNSSAGKPVSDVHTDLVGDTDLIFSDSIHWDVDIAFLCVGHGDARKFLEQNDVPQHVKIIDLSQDFRIAGSDAIGGRKFVYGLPEQYRDSIRTASNIANPGCFATCLQLALLPLASAGLIYEDVHISALTGSTGAGQSLSPTSHFSWRANNLSVYKPFTHQHLREVGQMVRGVAPDYDHSINFVPFRGDFTRGIIASAYTGFDGSVEDAYKLYGDYYRTAEFTHVSPSNINLKQVVNTNKCLMSLTVYEGKLLIVAAIDNLLKGASGQAVQNMNLMFGLTEDAGLRLKPAGF